MGSLLEEPIKYLQAADFTSSLFIFLFFAQIVKKFIINFYQ